MRHAGQARKCAFRVSPARPNFRLVRGLATPQSPFKVQKYLGEPSSQTSRQTDLPLKQSSQETWSSNRPGTVSWHCTLSRVASAAPTGTGVLQQLQILHGLEAVDFGAGVRGLGCRGDTADALYSTVVSSSSTSKLEAASRCLSSL